MAIIRSSTFTGTDGSVWNLDSGSWTHLTESGTFSTGPTETLLTNKGRHAGTSTNAIRRHYAGSGTSLNGEHRATVVRSDVGMQPGIIMRSTTQNGLASYYLAQIDSFAGKSTTYGLSLYRYTFGFGYTLLTSQSSLTSFGTNGATILLATRTFTLPNGNVRIGAKGWALGSAEPEWSVPSSDSAGTSTTIDGNIITGSLVYVDDATTLKDTAGYYGLYTEYNFVSATAATVDFDDYSVNDTLSLATIPHRVGSLGLSVTDAPASLVAKASPFRKGSSSWATIKAGTSSVTKVYKGSSQLWP